jgi:hypothetical protein
LPNDLLRSSPLNMRANQLLDLKFVAKTVAAYAKRLAKK